MIARVTVTVSGFRVYSIMSESVMVVSVICDGTLPAGTEQGRWHWHHYWPLDCEDLLSCLKLKGHFRRGVADSTVRRHVEVGKSIKTI